MEVVEEKPKKHKNKEPKEKKEKNKEPKEKKEKKKHKEKHKDKLVAEEGDQQEVQKKEDLDEKYKRLEKEVEEDIRRELEEQEKLENEQREKELKELQEKELKLKQEEELRLKQEEEQKLLEEGKELLTKVDFKIKADLKDSSDDEVEDSKTRFKTSTFNINSKYANRMLVFKTNCREKLNVYQGEVQRIKKRMGILTSKQQVYMCINRDRINLYKIPLTAVPIRQFLFDLEKISMEIDKNDNTVLRLNVNSKEYVFFKLDNEVKAKKWCNYVQKAITVV